MSSYSQAYKSSKSRKGKHRDHGGGGDAGAKSSSSTAVTGTKKGTPEPGIMSTRDSHPFHTSPSFERGRYSTFYGDVPDQATSARVTGAGGRGEASYSREGSPNSGPWASSSDEAHGEGPSRRRRRAAAHPADTTYSDAYGAVLESFHHSDDPRYWADKRQRERVQRRERERRGMTRQPDPCCVIL